jgi:hypothetical protein
MAQKKTEKKEAAQAARKDVKAWKKPKITRHGNMRQLTQTSPA